MLCRFIIREKKKFHVMLSTTRENQKGTIFSVIRTSTQASCYFSPECLEPGTFCGFCSATLIIFTPLEINNRKPDQKLSTKIAYHSNKKNSDNHKLKHTSQDISVGVGTPLVGVRARGRPGVGFRNKQTKHRCNSTADGHKTHPYNSIRYVVHLITSSSFQNIYNLFSPIDFAPWFFYRYSDHKKHG